MFKRLIEKDLQKIHEIGRFVKRRITQRTKRGDIISMDFWSRLAIDQDFYDRGGYPDDLAAEELADKDRLDAVRRIYNYVTIELNMRGFKNDLLSEAERESYWSDFDKLFEWSILNLRKIGMGTPHDRYWKSTILKTTGGTPIPLAQKRLSEKQVDEITGEVEIEDEENV